MDFLALTLTNTATQTETYNYAHTQTREREPAARLTAITYTHIRIENMISKQKNSTCVLHSTRWFSLVFLLIFLCSSLFQIIHMYHIRSIVCIDSTHTCMQKPLNRGTSKYMGEKIGQVLSYA